MQLNEMEQNYMAVLEEARSHFESICDSIPENFANLRKERLHDARILHIARKDDVVRLTLDGSGSFNNAICIVLTFKKVMEERSKLPLEKGQHWLYEEVDVHEGGAVFRVLFDRRMVQWMVVAENVIIEPYSPAKSLPVWQNEESVFGASVEVLSKVEDRLQVKFPKAYSELLQNKTEVS